MKYKTIILLLITTYGNAQQTINPNIKHDWEDGRYTVNGDGTITDNKTNLMWKRCTEGLSGSACTIGSATTYNWQQALDLANNSSFAGFSDWRLPNIKELRSIAAYDRYSPTINSTIFPNTTTSWFWSSSPNASNSDYVWRLDFNNGNDLNDNRDYNDYVRLVRGGQ